MLAASEGWQPLHPLSPLMRLGRFVIIGAVILSQYLDFALDNPLVALASFVLFVCVASTYGYVAWRFLGYRITDEHVEVKSGVLFRSHKRVPRARIESVDIARPAIARAIGLSELRIEVASSDESQLKLQYLAAEHADGLRSSLLRAARASDADGDGDGEALDHSGEVVAKVNTRDLVTAIVGSAALGAALTVLIPVVVGVFIAVVLEEGWVLVGLVPGLIAAAGILIRSVFQVTSLYNFELRQSGRDLTIRRGLLSLLTQKVPLDRVQAVRVEQPLFWRPFDRERLIIDVAGYQGGQASERAATAVLMPITTRDVTKDILAKVVPGLDVDGFRFGAAPEKARYRSPFAYRFYSVAMDGRFIASKTGVFRRRLDVIPHRKVQSLRMTMGPWQKRLGLSSLHVDSAGSNIDASIVHRTSEEATSLAEWSRAQEK